MSGHGSSKFRKKIIETSKGKYIIFNGENRYKNISEISVSVGGKTYTCEVEKDDSYYLVYCKLASNIDVDYIDINLVKFLDDKGNKIIVY